MNVRRGRARRLCTPTAGGVETVVAVGAPSRAGGSLGVVGFFLGSHGVYVLNE